MIYFLYGSDLYRLREKLKEIIHRYREVHGNFLNLVRMEAGESSFTDFLDVCHQPSMFIEHRLVIFKNPFQTDINFQKQLQKEVANLKKSPVIFVFYEEGKVDPQKILFREFKKQAQTQEFLPLKREQLLAWLDQKANSYSLVLTPEARFYLASLAQEDLERGKLALEKLTAYYHYHQKRVVSLAILKEIIIPPDKFKAFGVVNALQNNQLDQALSEANRYLDQQGQMDVLIGQLNSFLTHLLVIRTLLDQGKSLAEIKKEVSFSPGVVYHLMKAAREFTVQDLKEKINNLLITDRDFKTGRLSAKEAINSFLINFAPTGSAKY